MAPNTSCWLVVAVALIGCDSAPTPAPPASADGAVGSPDARVPPGADGGPSGEDGSAPAPRRDVPARCEHLSAAPGTDAPSADSMLGQAALALAPGGWVTIQHDTPDLNAAFGDEGAAGNIITFSTNGKWNPATQELFFLGGDHDGGRERFIRFDATEHVWSIEPTPAFLDAQDPNQNHGYDYDALDPDGQRYFYETDVYDIVAGTWSRLPDGVPTTGRAKRAYEYFPGWGLVALVYDGDGSSVWIFEEATAAWRELGHVPNSVPSGCTGCNPVAKYNPFHDHLLLGGSDGSDRLFRLDRDGTLTSLGPTPVDEIAVFWSILVADPATGAYLLLDTVGAFWELDPIADEWTLLDESLSPFAEHFRDPKSNDATGLPLADWGVTLWVYWNEYDDDSQVLLYRHGLCD